MCGVVCVSCVLARTTARDSWVKREIQVWIWIWMVGWRIWEGEQQRSVRFSVLLLLRSTAKLWGRRRRRRPTQNSHSLLPPVKLRVNWSEEEKREREKEQRTQSERPQNPKSPRRKRTDRGAACHIKSDNFCGQGGLMRPQGQTQTAKTSGDNDRIEKRYSSCREERS